MRRMIGWFRSWFGISQVGRQITVLDVKLSTLRRERQIAEIEIEDQTAQIVLLQSQFDGLVTKTKGSLERAVQLNKKLQAALDATQDELKTAHDITIPGLVASNQVLIQRWEAETQVFAVRTALANQALTKDVSME